MVVVKPVSATVGTVRVERREALGRHCDTSSDPVEGVELPAGHRVHAPLAPTSLE
jgi:hypothetical protein